MAAASIAQSYRRKRRKGRSGERQCLCVIRATLQLDDYASSVQPCRWKSSRIDAASDRALGSSWLAALREHDRRAVECLHVPTVTHAGIGPAVRTGASASPAAGSRRPPPAPTRVVDLVSLLGRTRARLRPWRDRSANCDDAGREATMSGRRSMCQDWCPVHLAPTIYNTPSFVP